MSEFGMLHSAEPKRIMQMVIEKKLTAILSYLASGKWHIAKVSITGLESDMLVAEVCPGKKPYPLKIQVNQPVGVSIKYNYGKFIFDTTVTGLEPSRNQESGGTMLLTIPSHIEMVGRRSYFRVNTPKTLKVNVVMWHRSCKDGESKILPEHYCQGRLIDISAGGAQLAIDVTQGLDFKKGQFIGLRFTPLSYEMPLILNAQIRNILPTADEKNVCIGLQLVGLEASLEGRETLIRLVGVVERYYQINQTASAKQAIGTIS